MGALATPSGWRESASAAVFAGVADGACTAAIWRRPLASDLREDVATMAALPAFRHRAVLGADRPALAVEAVLAPLGGAARWPAFARELRQLLALVGALEGLAPRSLRLECIDDDGCRLFHADRVAARLLCTYVGAGTELLPEAAADRTRMGQGDNRHVVDADAIVRVSTGAVLLMRGDLSPHGPGVLHRSPPNPARAPRLLAAVDA
ncbi:MAG: DUF1826 domain-containing protein [Silanimonas sp.]